MAAAYLNNIATAVPPHDVHRKFVDYAPQLMADDKSRQLFRRMAERGHIEHRYSFLQPHVSPGLLDTEDFYSQNDFPGTAKRMDFYQQHALKLAIEAIDKLDVTGTTHIIVTSCTGFYAPGLDLDIVRHYGLAPSVERTMIGFMGCYAAFNALKLARHIVRSDDAAKILVINLELCTLHLTKARTLEDFLAFLLFGDGCAASIVSAVPSGLELKEFRSTVVPNSAELITWNIGDAGFDMLLSTKVPAAIHTALPDMLGDVTAGAEAADIAHWAIHPGGRAILDAVRDGAGIDEEAMAPSRDILRRFGNMSSASIMFVLEEILNAKPQGEGCAMAFGPGLTVESMRFAGVA